MKYHYYTCIRCNFPFRTTIDNPNSHYQCSVCRGLTFREITEEEYNNIKGIAPE